MASNQEQVKAMTEEMEDGQEQIKTYIDCLVSRMDAHQAKTEANHEELMAIMKASGKRVEALIDVSLEGGRACQEATEACLEERPDRNQCNPKLRLAWKN
jgi:hypothetical protein